MTVAITTFADQSGDLPLSELDANFVNVVAAIPSGIVTAWTPTLGFGSVPPGGSTSLTYSSNVGFYIANLGMIDFWMKIVLTNKGSDTGQAWVSGLPTTYNLTAITNSTPIGICNYSGTSFTNLPIVALPVLGTTAFGLNNVQLNSATENPVTNAHFTNTSSIFVTGRYPI